jgi:hypothetical protein
MAKQTQNTFYVLDRTTGIFDRLEIVSSIGLTNIIGQKLGELYDDRLYHLAGSGPVQIDISDDPDRAKFIHKLARA